MASSLRHVPDTVSRDHPTGHGDGDLKARLIGLALGLGARDVPGWSPSEEVLTRDSLGAARGVVAEVRAQIRAGADPLGESFCRLRSPRQRRKDGAIYTPSCIVRAMLNWAEDHGDPQRVVDPGTGSGRFAVEAARRFPRASIVAVESDPLAAILARGTLTAAGFRKRARVVTEDYRNLTLPRIAGRTLYVGNPPYVRHHGINATWKAWLTREAAARGYHASQLAGLHVYFFLATLAHATPGDYGSFVTAAEWLDVNYGRLVRELFLGELGGQRIDVIEPTALPFKDAATTAAITCFEVGSKPGSMRFRRVARPRALKRLAGGRRVRRQCVAATSRWSGLTCLAPKIPAGHVELGEICRVHRGQVTGANRIWIAGDHCADLPPRVLFPAVTRARELFEAGTVLADSSRLRRVVDLPRDLSSFNDGERQAITRFMRYARRHGADTSYVATNRKAWWSVGLHDPAPILATYMARRPPAFVRNRAAVRHLNIAHGLYPRERLDDRTLTSLATHLSNATTMRDGRVYAGGLTKFEPREMERILVPAPDRLETCG